MFRFNISIDSARMNAFLSLLTKHKQEQASLSHF
jgi:hypothetical protein